MGTDRHVGVAGAEVVAGSRGSVDLRKEVSWVAAQHGSRTRRGTAGGSGIVRVQ